VLRSQGRLGSLRLIKALLRRLWPDLLAVLLVSAVSVPLGPGLSRQLTPDLVLPLLGVVASVLIGFRASQAYARWWEARTLWGQLRNGSRAWKASLLALAPGRRLPPSMQRMLRRQVLLVWTLVAELRPRVAPPPHLAAALADLERGLERPACSQALLDLQARAITEAFEAALLEPTGRCLLAEQLGEVLNAIGGLERIRAQPMPASLALFSRVVVWIFAWLMFLRLESDALTPALGNGVAFLLMLGYVGAERLASCLDHPLDDAVIGLPQHHICARISADLLGADHPLAQPPQGASATIWT
jgi:putative membrane protein